MESVGGQHGGVAMRGRKAPELGLDIIGPDPRRLQRPRPSASSATAAAAAALAAQPSRVEADPFDQTVVDQEGDANQVAAGRAAGGAAEGAVGRGPAARILRQDTARGAHDSRRLKLKRLQPAVFRPGLVTRVA